MRLTDEVRQAEVGVQRKVVLSAQGGLRIPVRVAVTCNPSQAVTLPNIAVPHYIGVPRRGTYLFPAVCLLRTASCPRSNLGSGLACRWREFFIDNLLVQIHLIIEMVLEDQPCAMGVWIPLFR